MSVTLYGGGASAIVADDGRRVSMSSSSMDFSLQKEREIGVFKSIELDGKS